MKTFFKPILLLCFLLIISACRKARKDVNDYYPEVSMVSATVTSDGYVEATADATLKYGKLEYIGFCMDTLPNPNMMQNQKNISEINGSLYRTLYDIRFDPNKTYYFRSWAASSKGYAYGNTISLSNIRAVDVSAPCILNSNSSSIGTIGNNSSGPAESVYNVSAASQGTSSWNIICNGSTSDAGVLNLSFGSEPKTAVYTTTEGSPYGNFISIFITTAFVSGTVKAGSKVYVNMISPGKYAITICSAPWKLDGSNATFYLNAKFTSPY